MTLLEILDMYFMIVDMFCQYFVKVAKVTIGEISETRVTLAMRRYCASGWATQSQIPKTCKHRIHYMVAHFNLAARGTELL